MLYSLARSTPRASNRCHDKKSQRPPGHPPLAVYDISPSPSHPIQPISLPIPTHPSHNFFIPFISSSSSQSRPSSPPAATHTWSTDRPRSAEPVYPLIVSIKSHSLCHIPSPPPAPPAPNPNSGKGEKPEAKQPKKVKNNYAVPTPFPPPPKTQRPNPSLPTPKRITNPTPPRGKNTWRSRGERHPKPSHDRNASRTNQMQ